MELVEVHNQAETAVYTVRKSLDELGDKVSQEERMSIEQAITDLETANKGDDVNAIKSKMDALMKAMEPISQRIYQDASKQQAGQQAGAQQDAGTTGQASQEKSAGNGDYVDADYKIVDDE